MASDNYRRYVLGLLAAVYTLNYLDRGLMILLLEPIKRDLHLTDTELGFLTGIAFGIFYALLGIPLGRWADRGNRVTLTSLAVALWGLTVTMCVLVTSFAQLVAARILAAVGEAGCMPPTYSLLGDYFPTSGERVRAMSLYWLASPVALLVSFVVGGAISARFGWRAAFFVAGLPALLIMPLVRFTVREPRATRPLAAAASKATPPLRMVVSALWRGSATRHLIAGIILYFTLGSGLAPWYAAFLMRNHGMTTSELGVWLGTIFGIGGIAGILLGTLVNGSWLENDEPAQMRLAAVFVAALIPCFLCFLLAPARVASLLALVPMIVTGNAVLGSIFALLQRLVPEETRATTLSLVLLVSNLTGTGLGPEIVGALSDWLRPSLGSDSLRYAMLIVSGLAIWAAYHLWQVSASLDERAEPARV